MAAKEEKRAGGNSDTTLRRNTSNPTNSLKLNGSNTGSINLLVENQRGNMTKRLESGSVSCENMDKQRWSSQETQISPKWSPMHSKSSRSETNGTLSGDLSPVDEKVINPLNGDGSKLSNVQTYREYKEALKQQRSQDSSAVYKNTSSSSSSSNQNSPISPMNGNSKMPPTQAEDAVNQSSSPLGTAKSKKSGKDVKNSNALNGNGESATAGGYIKPNSPVGVRNSNDNLINNNGDVPDAVVIKSIMNGSLKAATVNNTGRENSVDNKGAKAAGKRTVSWNRDIIVTEKNLSFTMRREFDRHKEEAELIGKLRNVSDYLFKFTVGEVELTL